MKDKEDEIVLGEEEIQRFQRLSFLVARKMGGRGSGEQLSKKMGQGMDFSGYQEYQPGDDIRYLDWNLYARLDRLYLKRFIEESEITVNILLDTSRSMSVGEPSKLTIAKKITAGLAYIGIHRSHHVGVGFFSEHIREQIPPLKGERHLTTIFHALQNITGTGSTDITQSLTNYGGRGSGHGLVVLISDLFASGGYEDGVSALLYKGYSIGILHLLSPEDQSPNLTEGYTLQDIETGEERWLDATADTIKIYTERMDQYQKDLRQFCLRRGIYYSMALTTCEVEQIIWGLLDGLRKGMRWRF